MAYLEGFLQQRFHVGTLDRHMFSVMGCELEQSKSGAITLKQRARLAAIDENLLTVNEPDSKGCADIDATPKQLFGYRSALGKMLYVGRMAQPIMLFHASHMASKISKLNSHQLKDLRELMRLDKKQIPRIRFLSPPSKSLFSCKSYPTHRCQQ